MSLVSGSAQYVHVMDKKLEKTAAVKKIILWEEKIQIILQIRSVGIPDTILGLEHRFGGLPGTLLNSQ